MNWGFVKYLSHRITLHFAGNPVSLNYWAELYSALFKEIVSALEYTLLTLTCPILGVRLRGYNRTMEVIKS